MEQRWQLTDRDLSWLSFNGRVLQEAADPTVPLLERLRFLAIYSSNLDEFFRVRVASIQALLGLKKKSSVPFDPVRLLERIHRKVDGQQQAFGKIYRDEIIPGLDAHGIRFVTDQEATKEQKEFARDYFERSIRSRVEPTFIGRSLPAPFLYNRRLYLAVILAPIGSVDDDRRYALVEIPSFDEPRFVALPSADGDHPYIFLDDLLRLFLPDLFPGYDILGAWSVKLTRDAELYIDDEFSGDLMEKIRQGVSGRRTGAPSRLLVDEAIPKRLAGLLRDILDLKRGDMVRGGGYHNYNDFLGFRNPGIPELEYPPLPPLPHRGLDAAATIREAVREQDRVLHFPYHSYHYVIRFLLEAATDPEVESIRITLYRVASDSEIARALIQAAEHGKEVTAFVEVKARFDEEANFYWAGELERAGVKVIYSFPGLKVHAKLCLVARRIGDRIVRTGFLSSGNFNEKSARIYCDHGLFTEDEGITDEMARVFGFLETRVPPEEFASLLVAPFAMRERFLAMIDREIGNARAGVEASIILKLNSLEDPGMIERLYTAAAAGVRVRLIVRGICRLVPEEEGMGGRIECVSIVDRFLEHSRVYLFHNGGDEEIYVGSADWMTRNLNRRVEVAFLIRDPEVRRQIRAIVDLHLQENVKARILNRSQNNTYRVGGEPVRSQTAVYDFCRELYEAEPVEAPPEPVEEETTAADPVESIDQVDEGYPRDTA